MRLDEAKEIYAGSTRAFAALINGYRVWERVQKLPAPEILMFEDYLGTSVTLRGKVNSLNLVTLSELRAAFQYKITGAVSWTETAAQTMSSLTDLNEITQSVGSLDSLEVYAYRLRVWDNLNSAIDTTSDINLFSGLTLGPGSSIVDYDDTTDTGFFGEVTSAELISGDALAADSTVNFDSSGTAHNSSAGWLKFYYQGAIYFVAKKTFRYGVSRDQIGSRATGARTITIDGNTYEVYLLDGGDSPDGADSEWNRLVGRVAEYSPTAHDKWAEYSSGDLGFTGYYGERSICRNTYYDGITTKAVYREGMGTVDWGWGTASLGGSYNQLGWRPMLKLVQT